jgi:nitrogen permease regulator 2-like protein
MPSDGDSFLPRIQSVFYAVFDVRQGPKLVYQVPEGLIASGLLNTNVPYSPSTPSALPATPSVEFDSPPFMGRRSPSLTVATPLPAQALRPGKPSPRSFLSPPKRSSSTSRTLFNFDEVSRYVIPPSALCGRLLKFATKRHRVVGFPVELHGDYPRNYFRYNLCFVFERTADLSCYEPVVRKIARVLTSCEVSLQ